MQLRRLIGASIHWWIPFVVELRTALRTILAKDPPDASPEVYSIIGLYQICQLGTGGMGFNWKPAGGWDNTPAIVIEAFRIIEATMGEWHNEQMDSQRQEIERQRRI